MTAQEFQPGDLVMFNGEIMRVVTVGEVSYDTIRLEYVAMPERDHYHAVRFFVDPLPHDGTVIDCRGCGWRSHRWIEATFTYPHSGFRTWAVRCVACLANDLLFRDVVVLRMSSTADLEGFGITGVTMADAAD